MVIAQNIHPHYRIILKFGQIVLLKTKMMKNKMKNCLFKYFNIQVCKCGPAWTVQIYKMSYMHIGTLTVSIKGRCI